MVSFICDECQSTLKKAKVQGHSYQCSSRSFSCIDCGVSFTPHSYNSHTQCVSEAEKYQGKLYKGKKHQPDSQQQQQKAAPAQQKRSAEETKEAEQDSSVQHASKKQKQTTPESGQTEEPLAAEQPALAQLLPSMLQGESNGLRWKQLSKKVRQLRPSKDKREVEDELWSALQQHRKQLTFSWTLTQ